MSPVEEKERVLDRVRKMLNTKGRTAEEAAAFAARAQDIMARYNLSVAEVLATGVKVEQKYTLEDGPEALNDEERTLLYVIANNNPVKLRSTGDAINGWNIKVFGLSHNIEAVLFMYVYLSREAKRLSTEGYKTYTKEYDYAYRDTPSSKSTWVRSFWQGFNNGLNNRLQEMKKSFETEYANKMALVVVQDQKLEEEWYKVNGWKWESPEEKARKAAEWAEKNETKKTVLNGAVEPAQSPVNYSNYYYNQSRGPKYSSRKIDFDAYDSGKDAAASVALNTPIENDGKTRSDSLTERQKKAKGKLSPSEGS